MRKKPSSSVGETSSYVINSRSVSILMKSTEQQGINSLDLKTIAFNCITAGRQGIAPKISWKIFQPPTICRSHGCTYGSWKVCQNSISCQKSLGTEISIKLRERNKKRQPVAEWLNLLSVICVKVKNFQDFGECLMLKSPSPVLDLYYGYRYIVIGRKERQGRHSYLNYSVFSPWFLQVIK